MPLDKWLLIPDCHVPYEDKRAFGLMLRAAKSAGVRRAAILGDFADFYGVSSHSKDPRRAQRMAWEVSQVRARLDELQKQFKEVVFVEGNHCDRLRRYLEERAPELFDFVSIDKLFGITERGWRLVPYREHTKIGKLHITHDLGKAGKYAHYDALAAFQGNVVIGHTHRLGYAVEGSARGKPHVGAMLGWLGDFSQVDYMYRVRAQRDWVHGFGIAYVEPSGMVHVTPIPVVNDTVVVEGKLIR